VYEEEACPDCEGKGYYEGMPTRSSPTPRGQVLGGILVLLVVGFVLTAGGGSIGAPELAIITVVAAVAIAFVIRRARTSPRRRQHLAT
jgi:hypothetical protein